MSFRRGQIESVDPLTFGVALLIGADLKYGSATGCEPTQRNV